MSLTPAIPSSSTDLALPTIPAVIVGLRRDGAAIIVIEHGGKEHRIVGADALWRVLCQLLDQSSQVVTGRAEPSEEKKRREALAKAFLTLGGKVRDRAADRVGEETVGAVETIVSVAGGKALGFLQRNAVRGRSSLGRRAAREAAKK